jgi:transposase InsO family protein
MGQASSALGISERTGYKWLQRFRQEGEGGLLDRSSRPHRTRERLTAQVENLLLALRREHRLPATALAEAVHVSRAAVGRLLRRHRLSRARDLEPREPARRYEKTAPGELLHLDIKKLGKIDGIGHRIHGDRRRQKKRRLGWEYAHVAIDDFSRFAYVEILPDERAETTAAFLERALDHLAQHHVTVCRLLTDNGSAYVSRLFASICQQRGLQHRRTRPYRPRTNGKAERFIQTALREWAYRRPYSSSTQRLDALPAWLHFYNHHRQHAALGRLPPASRLNNLGSNNN